MSSAFEDLASLHRHELRTAFKKAVISGEARAWTLPWCLLGPFVLPVLYLSIPHTKRPWLYRARFLVLAAIVALSVDIMRDTSSTNMACAYAVGLLASWGVIWSSTLLVWMRPQFEAERVEKRRRRRGPVITAGQNGRSASYAANGHANGKPPLASQPDSSNKTVVDSVPSEAGGDEDTARNSEAYEYYWQAFPANESFWTRLGWAVDLCFAFRGSGWNWAIRSIPNFKRPEKPLSGELVDISSIPLVTRSGYRRHRTRAEFLRAKLVSISVGYLVLDFCAVQMTQDPYFIFGPGSNPSPPPHLTGLDPVVLALYRSGLAFAGILAALHTILYTDQVVRCLVLRPLLGTRAELWHYPTLFGSFILVLDRGLAGFWGAWWHQSFRAAFDAPTTFLLRRGYLGRHPRRRRRAVAALVAFALSATLHASGSITTLPATTRWWGPAAFFLASCVGVLLQDGACLVLRPWLDALPRWCRRAGNLVFVVLWLHLTQPAFIDDLSRSALWLFEPVPVSVVRWLGFGLPGDTWWRLHADDLPKGWHWGRHWWESGLAL